MSNEYNKALKASESSYIRHAHNYCLILRWKLYAKQKLVEQIAQPLEHGQYMFVGLKDSSTHSLNAFIIIFNPENMGIKTLFVKIYALLANIQPKTSFWRH